MLNFFEIVQYIKCVIILKKLGAKIKLKLGFLQISTWILNYYLN